MRLDCWDWAVPSDWGPKCGKGRVRSDLLMEALSRLPSPKGSEVVIYMHLGGACHMDEKKLQRPG